MLHDSLGVDYRASEPVLVACNHIYNGEALAASINASYVGIQSAKPPVQVSRSVYVETHLNNVFNYDTD